MSAMQNIMPFCPSTKDVGLAIVIVHDPTVNGVPSLPLTAVILHSFRANARQLRFNVKQPNLVSNRAVSEEVSPRPVAYLAVIYSTKRLL